MRGQVDEAPVRGDAYRWRPVCTNSTGKEANMLDNAAYNLMESALHVSKGRHRYETTKHPEDAAIDLAALARLN